ncbi:MAG: hypothetical protein FWC35_00375, partial [Proteobacteria bacterium]|nr:hypothetical protein [Pseudomonadota bacterium]
MAQSKKGPFRWGILFTGIFLGIVTGLVMALTAAWKLGGNAVTEVFTPRDKPAASQRIPDGASTAKTGNSKAADKPSDKPSFDFYKVLPEGSNTAGGNTSAGSDKATAPSAKPATKPAEQHTVAAVTENTSARTAPATTTTPATATSTKPRDIYWLQVGSFSRQ